MAQSNQGPVLLQDIVRTQAERAPSSPALWWDGNSTTYAELWARIEQLAARIAACGEPGARIAVLAWNCPEFIDLIYAVPTAARVLVPLNARLAPAELLYQLQHSGATLLFADAQLLRPLADHVDFPHDLHTVTLNDDYAAWLQSAPGRTPPATSSEDPAWILFTSGSTGRPKGAVLTHRSFMAGLDSAELGRPVKASDRYYYPFPLFHVAAHNVLLQHRHGASVVLARAFDAAGTLAALREVGVTTLSLAPTMIAMLLDHPDFRTADLAGVRTIGYGASAMPVGLLRQLQSLSDVGLCQSYGMTELSGSVAFLTVEDHRRAAAGEERLLACVGKPLPTATVRLANDNGQPAGAGECGEILVRAEQVMAGYWCDAAATEDALRGGWLHTGDVGRFDEEGNLFIVDRKKDMIVSGGENVASREVEEVLRQHGAVKDCAVVGLPDNRWGEQVCAVVVERESVTEHELEQHCRAQLAGYKLPRRWFRLDALPLNASGKVDKPALRRRYTS
ncbi:MAG: AMP-binding protein [Halioglobus sp.]|nr:AMP-binding protein [Halioglobus sp.]